MKKIERMKAVLSGKTPDATPAGFWFHYKSDYTIDQMVDAHMELYKKTDMDIVKIMQDYQYPVIGSITTPKDWYKIKVLDTSSKEFKKMEEIIKKIADRVGGEAMIFQTMFSPFKAAAIAFGDELLMTHSKENPEAVVAGVKIISDALAEWAEGYLNAGADGIYYSAQFAEVGRFTYDEWAKLIKPSDIQILEVADQKESKYNILHICGEPEYDFQTHVDRYGEYPADIVNWSVKDNHYSLKRGHDFFKKTILGGLDNKGNIINGTDEDIRKEVKNIIGTFGQAGLIIGADCTIQGKNISLDKIRTAVEAAHNYQRQL